MQPTIVDQIRGVVYGQAIGDALGLGAEFLTKSQVKKYYPYGLTRYGQILRDSHVRRWEMGSWTDDTDQMLCIMDSLLQKREVNVSDIALKLYEWAAHGGMGIGRTVASVLFSSDFLADPHSVAKRIWEESGQESAANGGVMRTSILGVWDYQYPEQVKHNAEVVCKITHYDPRCVGSCVLVCLTISSLLRGQDVETILQQSRIEAETYDHQVLEYLDKAQESIEALDLDEGLDPETDNFGQIGYTLKALGAGFWALKNAPSYKEGILRVIYEGGDADSNAAVAGAILGARFGFTQLPQKLVEGLAHKQALEDRIEQLMILLDNKPAHPRIPSTTAGG